MLRVFHGWRVVRQIGLTVAHADQGDLDEAVASSTRAFRTWRSSSAYERSSIMRKAAGLIRERADFISTLMTMEQGKVLAESRAETLAAADIIEWFAEEARRTYGRVVPGRTPNMKHIVVKEPVGPVAAFTPWNFPINQAVKKLGAALAAGCSIIIKAPEETPASPAELVRAFVDAGLPAGVVNLVYGSPAQISAHLIAHPEIRKISFTGSTKVGKELAAMAGQHMKRVTMELGGHAPAIIFDDANIEAATQIMAAAKFRNAGQVCISPTRFLVQERVYEQFVTKFVEAANAQRVGNGLDTASTMGSLANSRRIVALEELIQDALSVGAKTAAGGRRIGNKGFFFQPTVLTDVPPSARAMNDEPFGPIALITRFSEIDEAICEANRLPVGLASYAFTESVKRAEYVSRSVEAGMMSINSYALALPETPFGGIKDSGYGSEGGLEGMEAYLNTKLVSHASI